MAQFGMTDTGFKPKRIADVYDSIKARITEITDDKTGEKVFQNESDDSLFMQVSFIVAEAIAECWEHAYQASTVRDPNKASGAILKGLIQLNGLVAKFGSQTQINVKFTGLKDATIPQGSLISDVENSVNYSVDKSVTIGADGTATGTATALTKGPINPQNNTVIVIKTPTYGWTNVTNTGVVVVGAEPQTDEELHLEQQRATSNTAYRQIDAIYAGLLNVSGVEFARVYQNTGLTTDSRGIDAKSVAAVVVGGTNEDIANSIAKKSANINSFFGSTEVDITDNQGQVNKIKFSRPEEVEIDVEVNITITDSSQFPASTEDAKKQIKQNIVSYAQYNLQATEGFAPGVDVIRTRLYTPVNEVPGFKINSLKIGKHSQGLSEADIDIAWNEVAIFKESNITVDIA
jgi:uncharacterized phage protein gp47/JayE